MTVTVTSAGPVCAARGCYLLLDLFLSLSCSHAAAHFPSPPSLYPANICSPTEARRLTTARKREESHFNSIMRACRHQWNSRFFGGCRLLIKSTPERDAVLLGDKSCAGTMNCIKGPEQLPVVRGCFLLFLCIITSRQRLQGSSLSPSVPL